MNEQKIIENMIQFIENKEKNLQQEKLLSTNQIRNDVVKAIIDKLEEEIDNENK